MAGEIENMAERLAALQSNGSGDSSAGGTGPILEAGIASGSGLERVASVGSGSGLDAVAGAAGVVEGRREVGPDPADDATGAQMREWKQHLLSQAELLRRDGAKVLAREKRARAEREKIREVRAAVEEERKQLQNLESQLRVEREAHHAREAKYKAVQAERDHWRGEVAQAQAALAEITRRQAEAARERSDEEQAAERAAAEREQQERQRAAQQEREEHEKEQRELARREQAQRELIERLEGRVGELLGAMESKEREVGAARSAVEQLQRELGQTRGAMERAREETQRVPVGGGAGVADAAGLAEERGRQIYNLQRELGDLQRERDAVKAKLGDLIEHVRRQEGGNVTERRTLETEVVELRTKCDRLLKEKDGWERERAENLAAGAVTETPVDEAEVAGEREELLHQKEELEAKAAQLEGVQRMLEKHELEWGRKLSEHSAVKTVAAAGIFVLLAIGAAITASYAWVRPVYRGEATVQVALGSGGEKALNTYLTRTGQTLADNRAVVEGAWAKMRQRGYGDDDTREGWVASLGGEAGRLTLRGDQAGRTLTLRYTGPTPAGVATACNALADTLVDGHSGGESEGIGAVRVTAPAVAPLGPMEDQRLVVGLEGAAGLVLGGAAVAGLAAWRKRRREVV